MAIQWEESWDIGCKKIDAQHRKWVEIFNDLENNFLKKNTVDDSLKIAFEKMINYTKFHFEYEEKKMEDSNYAEIIKHKRIHKNFDLTIYNEYRNFIDGKIILTSQILSLMKRWLIDHIVKEDKLFGDFLNKINSQK